MTLNRSATLFGYDVLINRKLITEAIEYHKQNPNQSKSLYEYWIEYEKKTTKKSRKKCTQNSCEKLNSEKKNGDMYFCIWF